MRGLNRILIGLAAVSGLELGPATAAEIDSSVLDNGLEVLFVHKPGVPLVTVEVAVRAGAFIETPELDGLTHLHEHMFFKANRAIPSQERYLQRLEELGMSWNGSTSHEVVRYYFTLPRGLLREGLVFMRDAIRTPLFLQEELEKERQVVLGEYDRSEARPDFHLWRAIEKALFAKHYSRKNVIGDRQVIATATREKLQHIQDTFYVPNNAALILAGEFERHAAQEWVEELFGDWQAQPDPFLANPVPAHPPLRQSAWFVVAQPVKGASLRVAWHGPSVAAAPRHTVVADVLHMLLAQPTHPFQKALVDSGLASAASLSYYTLKHVGPITLALETTPEKARACLSAARAALEALLAPGGIAAADVERAQRELIHEELFGREKARDFAIALGFWWSVGGTRYYLDYPEAVSGVTPEDLQAFLRRYLEAPHVVAAMVSGESAQAQAIDGRALEEAFEGAAQAFGPASGAHGRLELPSSARLIGRRVPGGAVAAFQVHFPGTPARVGAAQAGVEQLLLGAIAERLERRHHDELNRLGIRIRHAAEPDYSTLGVECLRAGLPRAVELLADALLRPDYEDADVERVRSRLIDAYRKSLEDPDRKVAYVANEVFFPPGHPYRAYPGGTEDALRALSRADLEAQRRRMLQGRDMVFVAVGDLELAEARALAEGRFGGIEPGATAASDFKPPALGGARERLRLEPRSIPTNYVLARFAAPAPGHPDFDAFQLAMRVLNRRLWLEVRSRRALTYAVSCGQAGRAANSGFLYVSTTQPNVALKVMLETVDELVTTPVSEADLRAAALTFSTAEYLRMEAPADQASRLAREEILGGDYRAALTLQERLEELRPAKIQEVLKTYVRDLHVGVLGPAEGLDRELLSRR